MFIVVWYSYALCAYFNSVERESKRRKEKQFENK